MTYQTTNTMQTGKLDFFKKSNLNQNTLELAVSFVRPTVVTKKMLVLIEAYLKVQFKKWTVQKIRRCSPFPQITDAGLHDDWDLVIKVKQKETSLGQGHFDLQQHHCESTNIRRWSNCPLNTKYTYTKYTNTKYTNTKYKNTKYIYTKYKQVEQLPTFWRR